MQAMTGLYRDRPDHPLTREEPDAVNWAPFDEKLSDGCVFCSLHRDPETGRWLGSVRGDGHLRIITQEGYAPWSGEHIDELYIDLPERIQLADDLAREVWNEQMEDQLQGP